jgi:hypothetical protein
LTRLCLKDSVSVNKIDYEHLPVVTQLDMGLRNLEIDIYHDEKGEKYAHPKGLDLALREARLNDRSSFEAACNSGAQIITTDYYLKSTHFKSDYSVSFDGGTYFRPNPVF